MWKSRWKRRRMSRKTWSRRLRQVTTRRLHQRPLLQRNSTRHHRHGPSALALSGMKRLPARIEIVYPAIVLSAVGCAKSNNRLPRIRRRRRRRLDPGNATRRIRRSRQARRRGLVSLLSPLLRLHLPFCSSTPLIRLDCLFCRRLLRLFVFRLRCFSP